MIDPERLLSRFLRYVQVDTTAREDAGGYPSSPGQLELGRMLVKELQELKLDEVAQSEFGIVTAAVPSNVRHAAPTIMFNSHFDTSPETSGTNVKPQVVRNYGGGDLTLIGDPSKVIRVADNPELAKMSGHTLITTDGTTLLGADDKAGMAVIMELVPHLQEDSSVPHGPVKIVFTCDEEIGHGVDHVDLKQLGATAAYTLDGHGADEIDVETFSADLGVVTVRGVNIHPSIGKGKMINAIRVAANFIERLPHDKCSPETTDGREGFLHPYVLTGSVAEATIRILLRDFDTPKLAELAALLKDFAAKTVKEFPGSSIDVKIIEQYRNMADGLKKEPRAVEFAKKSLEKIGRKPKLSIIRGGTDGSRFTERIANA